MIGGDQKFADGIAYLSAANSTRSLAAQAAASCRPRYSLAVIMIDSGGAIGS